MCRSPSTLTIGAGGVRATSAGTAPTSASAKMMILTDAHMAFDEFFFSKARDVYPRYDFARMNDDEYGATSGLD